MSLYKQWTDMVVEYVKVKGEAAFWKEYSDVETKIYKDLLANHKEVKKATIADLAKEYGVEGLGVCPLMEDGAVFYADYGKPDGA